MSNPILNTTQKTCAMCYKACQYEGRSNIDIDKVVELACHHFHHISCISKYLKNPENRQIKLACCSSCTQEFTLSAQGVNGLANQEIFQARLKELREIYDYDNEVVEAISVIDLLYVPLRNIYDSPSLGSNDPVTNQENEKQLFNSINDFFMKKEEIKEDLKKVIVQILGSVIMGGQALRAVDDEAGIWKNTPFENLPNKIKQEGIFVQCKDEDKSISIRISANHLKKIANKLYGKDLANHYQRRSEHFFASNRSWTPLLLLGGLGGAAAFILAKKF